MTSSAIIADVSAVLAGEPVYLAGSLVAEETYGLINAHSDVDLFCPSGEVLVASIQKLLDNDYSMGDRSERVWSRWKKMGFKKWHTNSIRLDSPDGTETNLIYKTVDGHATTSLAQVLESFDFGLLATGYDLSDGIKRDMRSFLFPGFDIDGPLPMMPNKREAWRNGYVSKYNGTREFGRYLKYYNYGYDMSMVKDDLVLGYQMASYYYADKDQAEDRMYAKLYSSVAETIEANDMEELAKTVEMFRTTDALDVIMESLE